MKPVKENWEETFRTGPSSPLVPSLGRDLGSAPTASIILTSFLVKKYPKASKIFSRIGHTTINRCRFQFSEIKSPGVRKSFIFHDIPTAYSYLAVSGSEPTATSAGNLFSIIFCLLLNLLDQTILCSPFPIHL